MSTDTTHQQAHGHPASAYAGLLAGGGKVLVVGGMLGQSWAKWKHHPQVEFWTGDEREVRRIVLARTPPANLKAVVISRYISHREADTVKAEAKRRQAIIIGPKNDGEVTQLLEAMVAGRPAAGAVPAPTPPTPAAAPPALALPVDRPRGWLRTFVATHQVVDAPIAAEGRRLYAVLTQAGIPTTEASVIQSVSHTRRQLGIVAPARNGSSGQTPTEAAPPPVPTPPTPLVPPPAPQPSPPVIAQAPADADDLLRLLDEVTAGLALVKEQVVAFYAQQGDYRRLKAKLADLLRD